MVQEFNPELRDWTNHIRSAAKDDEEEEEGEGEGGEGRRMR